MQLLNALGTVAIGMGVVFSILILICLIIYSFNIFPYIEKKFADKKADKSRMDVIQDVVSVPIKPGVENGISGEEIAAIAAAIEAYTGMSQSDFVVRKIVRR